MQVHHEPRGDRERAVPSGSPPRLPVLFVGHGSPMNAIEDNVWSRALRALGAQLPRPRAILSVSAHWFVPGSFVGADERPETIHDFSGFPPTLYAVQYPAPGDVGLARRVAELLGPARVAPSTDWGLDHGTWSVLVHLHPAADVPVVQLSIHDRLPPLEHLALGRALAPLRDEGVLVMGSGNLVHNLGHALRSSARGDFSTPAWASAFDAEAASAVEAHDHGFLARALESGTGRMAHPTPDHYLPLLYAAGAAGDSGPVRFPVTGFDLGSLSMRSIWFE
jgi:4,5-DOPA dioxygenase extradiol